MVLGILAHVDAGKTTLSEAILYNSGKLRKLGRVDNQDAFLDTYELEKKRGITIFSKQAVLKWEDREITLWIHRGMWIFRQRWNVLCRSLTVQFW